MPEAAIACIGVYLSGELVGGLVFTSGSRGAHRLIAAARPQDVIVLARLWLADLLPKNSESRVIAVALRMLRRMHRWKCVLSYADPAQGHRGSIYQATGWLYLGKTAADAYVDLGDGHPRHPRSVYQTYGTNSVRRLRLMGLRARRVPTFSKFRYVHFLDPTWRWRLRLKPQPHPKETTT